VFGVLVIFFPPFKTPSCGLLFSSSCDPNGPPPFSLGSPLPSRKGDYRGRPAFHFSRWVIRLGLFCLVLKRGVLIRCLKVLRSFLVASFGYFLFLANKPFDSPVPLSPAFWLTPGSSMRYRCSKWWGIVFSLNPPCFCRFFFSTWTTTWCGTNPFPLSFSFFHLFHVWALSL